jgi:hypothetical protein
VVICPLQSRSDRKFCNRLTPAGRGMCCLMLRFTLSEISQKTIFLAKEALIKTDEPRGGT